MKQIYSLMIFSMALIFGTSVSAQTEFYYEDFDGGLPDGWQSIEVTGDGSPSASWIWTDTGPAGAFATDSLASESAHNGWMIFDSDLNCSGEQETWLISAPIDCSGKQNIVLEFNTFYRRWNDVTSIEVSTDLTNWTSIPVFNGYLNGAYSSNDRGINPTIERAVIAEVADGEPKVFIAFKFLADQSTVQVNADIGCGYNWQIDDVRLLELTEPKASINYSFYTPFTYAVPRDQADADGFFFSAGVKNDGAVNLENGMFRVDITNEDTDEIVWTQSIALPTILVNSADTFTLSDEPYYPTDLDIGPYSFNYVFDFSAAGEIEVEDNSQKYFFEVTGDYFAKEDGENIESLNPPDLYGEVQTWKMAAVYLTSPNLTDPIVLKKLSTSIYSDAGSLTDNYVRFVVAKLNVSYPFGDNGEFDRENEDPTIHDHFDPPVYDDFYIFTNEASGDIIDIEVSDDSNEITLEPGSAYAVIAIFDGVQAGAAATANNFLGIGNTEELISSGVYIVFDDDANAWYTGIIVATNPFLRMTVNMDPSGVDDNPLPEHVFQISPNPASDYITADINFDEASNMNLLIADIKGQILHSKDYNSVSSLTEKIELANFASGTYFIRVSTLEGTKTHTFIIQH